MTTDPRFVRSADALAEAVLALAAATPIEEVTVTEVARSARVTRATFYNHATSPAALLARVLEKDLDSIRAGFLARVEEHPGAVEDIWRASELELVAHVLRYESVYRRGLIGADDARGSVLATLLAGHVEASLVAFAIERGAATTGPDAVRLAMAAAFVGQGTAGAIRAWLSTAGTHDADEAVGVLITLIPQMWFEVARA